MRSVSSSTARTLAQRAASATGQALADGSLQPISTSICYITEAGIEFPVRRIELFKKQAAGKRKGEISPFLNPEPSLLISEISPTHVCLLNKFPVFDHHLLIVTRKFEEQDAPLNLADFSALWKCLKEFPGLAFYNGGRVSGASQQHKHLQLVPLPLAKQGYPVPIAPLLALPSTVELLGRSERLPFSHVLARLPTGVVDTPDIAAELTLSHYRRMLSWLGIDSDSSMLAPYNLLVTTEWILVVPRRLECYSTISINALGFAGHFLVRDDRELKTLQAAGPLHVLSQVAVP